jgi:hypothetical protein
VTRADERTFHRLLIQLGLPKIAKAWEVMLVSITVLSGIHETRQAIEQVHEIISHSQILGRIALSVLFFSGYFVISFMVLGVLVMFVAKIVLDSYDAITKRRMPDLLSNPAMMADKSISVDSVDMVFVSSGFERIRNLFSVVT